MNGDAAPMAFEVLSARATLVNHEQVPRWPDSEGIPAIGWNDSRTPSQSPSRFAASILAKTSPGTDSRSRPGSYRVNDRSSAIPERQLRQRRDQ
jgi:hypothetical protein